MRRTRLPLCRHVDYLCVLSMGAGDVCDAQLIPWWPRSGLQLLYEFTTGPEQRTVICAIHQPRSSIFHMFHQILVMSRGYAVYMGSPLGVVDHFASLSGTVKDSYTRCA